jgi:ketosteroid isomerase-like protein
MAERVLEKGRLTMKAQYCLSIACLILFPAVTLAESKEDVEFRTFLMSFEDATSRFINGDPTLWKQHADQAGDATIMGAWGAYEKGWPEVSARYDWAASRFRPSGAKVKVEYLSTAVSGNLACTVAIERSEVLLIGQDSPAAMELRVTHSFRKQGGVWKLMHRHADRMMKKAEPGSVLK